MRAYELVLILKTSLKETDRKKITDNLKDLIGKNFSEKEMGQLPLSYPIKKEVSGYFVSINFETESLPENMEKNILTNDGVLRHLLLSKKLKVKSEKVEEKKVEKKPKKHAVKKAKTKK